MTDGRDEQEMTLEQKEAYERNVHEVINLIDRSKNLVAVDAMPDVWREAFSRYVEVAADGYLRVPCCEDRTPTHIMSVFGAVMMHIGVVAGRNAKYHSLDDVVPAEGIPLLTDEEWAGMWSHYNEEPKVAGLPLSVVLTKALNQQGIPESEHGKYKLAEITPGAYGVVLKEGVRNASNDIGGYL